MKIAIATAVYYPQINGVAVFSHNLAVGLAKRGHEVIVLTPSQNGQNHIETQDNVKIAYLKSIAAKVYPDQIHTVPPKRKLFYRHGFRISIFPEREVAKILGDFRPDVVHIQVSDPIGLSVVSWARKHNVPVVTTEHNQPEVLTESLKMPRPIKKSANILLQAYFRNRQRKSDFATMPTKQAIHNLLAKHPINIPIAAVSNGVDLSHFKPGKTPNEIYQKYRIPKEAPIALYIGRIDPEKNVETVIKAFKQARIKTPTIELVIVGDGVDKARLERKYKNHPEIHFLGRILPPNLYELYRVGKVFVTASEIETQGIVLIEAAATGLPLIAVDKGAVKEVCQNDKNGFLCEPGSISEIAKAMIKILSNDTLREKFSKASLEIAAEHNFEKTLDRFINIYQKVIKQKSS